MPRHSILDLAPIPEGRNARDAIANSVRIARAAEALGYTRFWLAEHHNMPGIASAATSVVIGHVAGATKTIRVGAGGIMLPNHAPLVIAEQFGTLATIHGDRIDLGLGRAPGTDMATARALRRGKDADRFPEDVQELLHYLGPPPPDARVRAVPGADTNVPVYILGSSLYGAQLAAHLGLPYAFASHFAPDALHEAAAIYRQMFQPSAHLDQPYFIMAMNVFAAETDADGVRLMTSMQQSFANLRTGRPGPMPRPVHRIEDVLSADVLQMVEHAMRCTAAGSPETVRDQIAFLSVPVAPDEIIVNGAIYDQNARAQSFEIAAEAITAMDTNLAAMA
ncbi:MAG: LLM class flavin-dependent oxidoreductase [Pseudomonadota bacterium]